MKQEEKARRAVVGLVEFERSSAGRARVWSRLRPLRGLFRVADDQEMSSTRFQATPFRCFPPPRCAADPQRVRALAELFSRQRWASTVFNVTEIPGPAWRGYFELRDASQVDELEAAVEARLPSVAFQMLSE